MALNRTWRAWLSRGLTTLAFIVGAVLFYRLWRDIQPRQLLSELTPGEFVLMALLPLLTMAAFIVRARVILKWLGVTSSWAALATSSIGGFAVGYLVSGGEVTELATRALLLGRTGVSTKAAVLSSVIDGFARWVINSILMGLVSLSFLFINSGDPRAEKTVILGASLSAVIILTLLFALRGGLARWFIKMAARFTGSAEGATPLIAEVDLFTRFFNPANRAFIITILLTTLIFIWEPWQLWLITRWSGIDLPIWAVFWLYQVIIFPQILPIPGGLGLSEGIGSLFSQFIGGPPATGFILGLLWRLRILPYIFIGIVSVPFVAFLRRLRNRRESAGV